MTTPNGFILHRWPYSNNFDNLVSEFNSTGFIILITQSPIMTL